MAINTAVDYVQRALALIDADNVSEISDSVEGDQVFVLLKNVYDELLDAFPWPHLKSFAQLQATGTNHIMKLPVDVVGFKSIRYNKNPVTFMEPMALQDLLDSRDTTLTNVDVNGAISNRDPQFWTTIDDENILFDSYNTSLQSSLSRIDAVRKPDDLIENTDRPDVVERMEPVLRNMLFAEAFRVLKADETRADTYDKKVKSGMAKLKRWAKRHDRNSSWYGRDYGRRNTSLNRRTTIRVIEA